MYKTSLNALIVMAVATAFLFATPDLALAHGDDAKIKVVTQNQYLGASLTPIVAATDPAEFNAAVIVALLSIAANDFPERVQALAETIADKKPDLVGLQEVFSFSCIPISSTIPDPCGFFAPAFNDHLSMTLSALADHNANYYVAATVQNLTFPPPGFPFPGLPVFLDLEDGADALITVIDRDVILARSNVPTTPVPFVCVRPSVDGCNYQTVAQAITLAGVLNIERGFVGVDAVVKGNTYRFINTHLEVQFPAPDPLAPLIQAAQASELIGTLASQPGPPGSRLLVVGDINSSPTDPLFPDPGLGPFHSPYQQFVNGTQLTGVTISAPHNDVWTLRDHPAPGNTCCEFADLSNAESIHAERIDVILSLTLPSKAKADVLNTDAKDKTASDLWPSDHATVRAKLEFDDDDSDDSDDDDGEDEDD